MFSALYFDNKVVVITGGTDGIGRSLVNILSGSGALVVSCGKSPQRVQECKELFIGRKNTDYLVCDVRDKVACKTLVDFVVKQYGRIDILINNAGVSMRAEFEDLSLEVAAQVMAVNFFGAVYMTKWALPYIIACKGTIVGISSVAGYRATPGRCVYSASKFALNGFLESLRVELKKHRVRVLTVAPGFIASNIRFKALDKEGKLVQETHMEEHKMMQTNTCALHILDAIRQRKQRLTLTFLGKMTIFLNKLFPKLMDGWVYRFYYKNRQLIK